MRTAAAFFAGIITMLMLGAVAMFAARGAPEATLVGALAGVVVAGVAVAVFVRDATRPR